MILLKFLKSQLFHNFDIFCVGESFLPSDIEDDDPSISIDNFELTRCKYAFIIKITYHWNRDQI